MTQIKKTKIFTIIELLVVIAIISILASMLLPALSKARNKAKTVTCSNNLKNISMASKFYSEDFQGYFAMSSSPQPRYWEENGTAMILPWYNLFAKFGPSSPCDYGVRLSAKGNSNTIYCPGENQLAKYKYPSYADNHWLHGTFSHSTFVPRKNSQVALPSRTIEFIDSGYGGGSVPMYTVDYPFAYETSDGSKNPFTLLRHNGKGNIAWQDGHVSTEISREFWGGSTYRGMYRLQYGINQFRPYWTKAEY
jgi:prepilin-type processing-associated H-X9-DG protein/prepilin-type N-terminal cleavage/methylation domain-containing protein